MYRGNTIENVQSAAIFGDGPAAIGAAKTLIENGIRTDLFCPPNLQSFRSIYTCLTNPVGNSINEILYPVEIRLLPHVRNITLRATDFRLESHNSYGMLDTRLILERNLRFLSDTAVYGDANVSVNRYKISTLNQANIIDNPQSVIIEIDGSSSYYDLVFDCTGTNAVVSAKTDKARNRKSLSQNEEPYLTEWVYGMTVEGHMQDEMILIYGPAGGTCWVNPSIEDGYVDVVFSAWGNNIDSIRFFESARVRLNILENFVRGIKNVELSDKKGNYFAGKIRQQPAPMPQTNRVYAYGEAAGMAAPGTGDSWARAYWAGRNLTKLALQGKSPQEVHHFWTNKWKADRFLLVGSAMRIKNQDTDLIGSYPDKFYKWLTDPKNNHTVAEITHALEKWLIDGQISIKLLDLISKEKTFIYDFIKIYLNNIYYSIYGHENIELPFVLPDV